MQTRRWLTRAVALAFIALVAFGMYRMFAAMLATNPVSWKQLTQWRPAALPLLVSFVLLVGVYVAHALLWRRIMNDLAIATPSFATTLRVYFVAGLVRYVPLAKFGQLPGLAVLAKRAGMPPGSAAAAAVLGQLGFLTTGLMLLGLTLPEWRAAVQGSGEVPAALPLAVGTAMVVGAAVTLWILVATPWGHGFRSALVRRLGTRAGAKLHAAFDLADRVKPLDAVLWAAGYALSWFVLGIAFALFVAAFHPAVLSNFRFVAGTVAASYLLGYLAFFLPAGIGVREGAMVALLSLVMPLAGAIVVGVMSRVWFTAAELAPLAALPALKHRMSIEGEEG